jgi:plastocyanin
MMRGNNVMSKKRLGFFMMMLAILALGSILFAACTRPGTTPSGRTSHGSTPGSEGGGTTVHLGNTNFLVSSITIPKGSKLTLVDDVPVVHIIKNGSWVNSSPQTKQEPGVPTINVTFNGSDSHDIGPFTTAGTFHIYCTIHVNMNLTITVH